MALVYISGKISGNKNYINDFENAEKILKEAGHEVINPIHVTKELPILSHEEYMNICIPMVGICDAIYMIDGWEKSKGAKFELSHALMKNKDIMTECSLMTTSKEPEYKTKIQKELDRYECENRTLQETVSQLQEENNALRFMMIHVDKIENDGK